MARKHPNPLEDPPAASSSGEEEEEVEEEEYEEVEEEVEEEEEEEEDVPNGNRDGSDDGEEEEEVEEEVEEEDEEEVEEYDNEEEDKEEVMTEKSNPQSPKSKPVSKNPNSRERDDDDDEETESDSGSRSPGVSGFTIKKHVSRPAIDSPNSSAFVKPKRSAAKTATDKESLSPVLVSMKRPAEADVEIGQKDSKSSAKKPKSENGGGDEGLTSEKKFFINRLWNEESEIAILKGMIEFHEKRGVDPNSDSTAFHEFVKDKLSVEVSKSQVMEKVRRLKKKYKNNVGKGENGEDPVFSRPHELKSFELSKKIWGGVDIQNKRSSAKKKSGSGNAKPDTEIGKDNGNAGFATSLHKDEPLVAVNNKEVNNKEEQGQVQEEKFSQLYPFLNLSLRKNNFSADLISKEGAEAMMGSLRRLEKSQLEELDEEWRKQILAEADLCTRRSALLQKQVQLISDWNSRRG